MSVDKALELIRAESEKMRMRRYLQIITRHSTTVLILLHYLKHTESRIGLLDRRKQLTIVVKLRTREYLSRDCFYVFFFLVAREYGKQSRLRLSSLPIKCPDKKSGPYPLKENFL